MSTHVTTSTTSTTVRPDLSTAAGTRPSRTWGLAGIGAGLAGIGTIVTSSGINAVYDPDLKGDAVGRAEKLADQTVSMYAFHTVTALGAVLLVVFAAGLYQRLRATSDGAAPLVAFAGLVGTAVVTVLGSGLDTEFMMGLPQEGVIDPYNAVFYNHWTGTIPWCWVLVGLSGLAVHVVARAQGAPRWVGRVGLVLGGITLLAGISPLQYVAGMTGPIWVLVTAIGFVVGDKAFRAAH